MKWFYEIVLILPVAEFFLIFFKIANEIITQIMPRQNPPITSVA